MISIDDVIKSVKNVAKHEMDKCMKEAEKTGRKPETCIVHDLAFGIASDMIKYGDWADVPPEALEDEFTEWWYNFTQYEEYSNWILPELRRAVGCTDVSYVGTYTGCDVAQLEEVDDLVMELEGLTYDYLKRMINEIRKK